MTEYIGKIAQPCEKTKKTKKKKPNKYTYKDWPKEWQGIKPRLMRRYRPFINKELPGYCGTYTAAALVHYAIQADRGYDFDMDQLIEVLKPVIDIRLPYKGTYPWDVTYGLNKLFEEDEDYEARWHLISDPVVTKQLAQPNPLPVIVGTAKFLGSPYRNHWVLVYQFGYNDEGKLFYRVYDNHGKTQAVIPASQTLAAIWLERN